MTNPLICPLAIRRSIAAAPGSDIRRGVCVSLSSTWGASASPSAAMAQPKSSGSVQKPSASFPPGRRFCIELVPHDPSGGGWSPAAARERGGRRTGSSSRQFWCRDAAASHGCGRSTTVRVAHRPRSKSGSVQLTTNRTADRETPIRYPRHKRSPGTPINCPGTSHRRDDSVLVQDIGNPCLKT